MFSSALLSSTLTGDVPEGFVVRPLNIGDYDKGFLSLLSQLTRVGDVTRENFVTRFRTMADTRPTSYYVVVIEETSTHQLVGSATLVLEWKFIHAAGARARIEDVVIRHDMRGRKLGALLNRVLVSLAKLFGVYKISLECKDSLIPFYELNGFKKDEGNNFLVQRFDKDITISPTNDTLETAPEVEQSKI
ncbi:unnamed protein product, partial [Mesorhabditis belari]|uniref:Glucosamine 6-phosphate N-acetyltransferase n=1 Tax=Mesorhabditis belari TaxID=2138241 RepID=A0AAF3EY38_9BILA